MHVCYMSQSGKHFTCQLVLLVFFILFDALKYELTLFLQPLVLTSTFAAFVLSLAPSTFVQSLEQAVTVARVLVLRLRPSILAVGVSTFTFALTATTFEATSPTAGTACTTT